jgi:hypothetical protein
MPILTGNGKVGIPIIITRTNTAVDFEAYSGKKDNNKPQKINLPF